MKEATDRNVGRPLLRRPLGATFSSIVERADAVLAESQALPAQGNPIPAKFQPEPFRRDAAAGDGTARIPHTNPTWIDREGDLPILASSDNIRPGGLAEIEIQLVSEGTQPIAIGLAATDLVSASNGRISSLCVSFDPIALELVPGCKASLRIVTAVPPTTSPGLYSGIVQVTGQPLARAVLSVKVD